MTAWVAARLWRWPLFGIAVTVSLWCTWVFKDQSMYLPTADGPRYTRQFVIALLPLLGSICLVDPTPELTPTLPRARIVYQLIRWAVLVGALAPLAVAWSFSSDVNRAMYDLFVLASLYTIGVGAVSRWQAAGLLGACLVAVCWLLADDSLAVMLRFADISGAPQHPSASGAALALIASLCAVITAVRGAGSPTRASRLGSRWSLRRN